MKDLDPAFRGAGQKEYPFFYFTFLYYVLIVFRTTFWLKCPNLGTTLR
jgi:hypothetical protein